MHSSRETAMGRANIEVSLVEVASRHQEGLNPGFSRSLVQSGSFLINARSAPHAIQFLETGVSRAIALARNSPLVSNFRRQHRKPKNERDVAGACSSAG
jgi:hypothetical protein